MNIRRLIKSKLVSETLVYGLTNALYTGLPLLLMPFLVAVMSPEDYGMVDLFRSLSQVLTAILGLSTIQSIGRFYFDLQNSDFRKFVSSVVLFQLFSGILGIVIILSFSWWLEEKYKVLAFLSVIFFAFNQIMEGLLVIYRVEKKSKKYLIIRIASVALDIAILTGFYFFYTSYDWTYRVYPNVISVVVFGVISILLLLNYGYKPIFDRRMFREAVIYSSPLVLHMLSGYILNLGDRFFIAYFLGDKALGNYAVAYQLGMAINFFYTSFNLAWTPTFYEWMKDEKYLAIAKIKKLVYIAVPVLGGGMILLWTALYSFMDSFSKYSIPFNIVVIIVVSYVLFSLYKFEANYYLYSKDTKKLSVFTFSSAIVSVVLNIILIPKIGILGAAIATLGSFLLMYFLVYVNNRERNNKGNQHVENDVF